MKSLTETTSTVLAGRAQSLLHSEFPIPMFSLYERNSLMKRLQATLATGSLAALRFSAAVLLALASTPAHADTISWAGTDVTNPTFWDTTTPNWSGDDTVYADGDDVTFGNAGSTFTVDLQSTVSPGSMAINATGGNDYTFNSGDIAGTTSIVKSGDADATFTQDSLSFSGGTQLNNSRINFRPTTAGPHSFGSDPIVLNNGGSTWFNYDPTTIGAELTNDFIVNGTVTWRNAGSVLDDGQLKPKNPGTSGIRTGNIFLNGTLQLQIGDSGGAGSCPGCHQGTNLRETVLLTGDRTILGGERFFAAATTISGDIGHDGSGPHELELRHRGDNPDWEFFISAANVSDPDGWDVANIRRTSFSTARGTLVFQVDETEFFNNLTANGGSLFLEGGGMRFHDEFTPGIGNDPTANINFSLIVEESALGLGTGFRHNTEFNVLDGGTLGGNGAYRSGIASSPNNPFENPLDVNVMDGGTISPGNPELNNGIGTMEIHGDLTFVDGGQLVIQITGADGLPGIDQDQLIVQDSVSAAGRGNVTGLSNAELVIDFSNGLLAGLDEEDVITILTSANDLTGMSFGSVTTLGANNILFDVVFGNGFIQLQNFTVPEPTSSSLLGFGLLAMATARRRRAQRRSLPRQA